MLSRKRSIKRLTYALTVAGLLTSITVSFASGTLPQNLNNAPSPNGGTVAPQSTPSDADIIKQADSKVDIVADEKKHELSPEEIKQIKDMWEQMRRVQETPVGDQPKPEISTVNLDLSPGSTPPVVRISSSTGVIMDFMDASGKPWMIDHAINMSANEIDLEGKPFDPKHPQNSVFAKAKRYGSVGNVAVFLRNLSTPVIVTLLAGQKSVDYRVDFRVPAYLGNSDGVQYVHGQSNRFDNRLTSASMGITPSGCKQSISSVDGVMAWSCGEAEQIIRTNGILLSPATLDGEKMTGLDGTNVYLIPKSPVVSVAVGGSIKNVEIKNFEDTQR